MAAVTTGTATAVTWASGADPAAQNISIPADATAVYMFWSYYHGTAGHGLASATLNSASASQSFEVATATGDQCATGVSAWYNPSTGTQSLDVSWDAAPVEGPVCIVVYVKDGDTTAWRDADAANETFTNACSVTLTTTSGDLVIKFDQRFSGSVPPSTSASWTSIQTHNNNSESARASYISATGSTEACNSEDESYSTVVAISIPAGSAATPRPVFLGSVFQAINRAGHF